MNEKKIEPTAAMVRDVECWRSFTGTADRTPLRPILRAALNHYDAPGLFADEDARPWESLGESDQVCVGDEVKWDYYGLTMTATVARVDKTGSLYTAAGLHIGVRSVGTWYVRRAAQELPTEPGAVIVPADGHEHITATVGGVTYRAREAIFSCSVLWLGVWRSIDSTAVSALPEDITPGTWKVEGE